MADYGAFQVKTPQEVLAELNAKQQQIQQLGDPQSRRLANIQFQMTNLFGNPELKKARKVEGAIKTAEAMFDQTYQGDPKSLEGEARRLQLMYDQVKEHDPAAAAQIQTSLAELDAERFERKRLTDSDDRAERNTRIQEERVGIEREKFGRMFDASDVGYTTNPDDPKTPVETYDLTDPKQAQAYLDAKGNGQMPINQEQALELLGREEMRNRYKNLINNSGLQKKLTGYDAQNQYLDKATKMIGRFRVNPETGLLVMDVKRGISNVASEARALIRKGGWMSDDGYTLNERATQGRISELIDEMVENNELEISQQDRALYEAAVLNMGYVLARSLDSGGRLSDQDVNMAIKMLTGGSALFEDGTISVPANQMVTVLYDRAMDIQTLLQPDSVDGIFVEERAKYGDEQALLLRQVRNGTQKKFEALDAVTKTTLPEHMYNRVRHSYDPSYLTDEQVREMEYQERRASDVKDFRDAAPTHQIFRPDKETEKMVPKGATIVYGENGQVSRILDTPEDLAKALRSAKPGERYRFRDPKTGEIISLRNPAE